MGCSSSTPAATSTTTSSASKLVSLLGEALLSKDGVVATADALAGKAAVALYFSAHWCPPCRGFTPALSKAYVDALQKKGLEIVFISSDRDERAFDAYRAEMPWLALPFASRELKNSLSTKFRVSGIPTLVVLDGAGRVITENGRQRVMSDPTGKWLPEPPPTPIKPTAAAEAKLAAAAAADGKPAAAAAAAPVRLRTVIGAGPLLDTDGKTRVELAHVAKDAPLVALYFSAHWCGPCRRFTPQLTAFSEALEQTGKRLPILFGSSDKDEKAFDEYFASMPWYALPFGDARIDALKKRYDVSGIPWLVVLDAAGNLVANEADTDVPMGAAAYEKWLKLAKKEPAAAPAA